MFWQNETDRWYLLRGEWMHEIKASPSVLYFTNIIQNVEMKSYFQPLPPRYVSKAEAFEVDLVKDNFVFFNSTDANLEDRHIIFVIHGIGHHEGEEKIVKNANSIRNGFIKYTKKFHPTFKMPVIIPVPWRYNLSMDDEKILNSQMLRPEIAKDIGLIFNDVENLFFIGSPLGRFLINKKYTFDQLNQNHWIKNGKLFNILHSDDPVAHRLETVFNNNYKYVAPSELYLNQYFRKAYAKTLKISEEEAFELVLFHNYFISDRKATKLHDSFLTIDYAEYGYKFVDNSVTLNATNIFEANLEFLKHRFSGKQILKDPKIIRDFAITKIPHRYDYTLYKTEYDENGEENTLYIERKFIDWIAALGFAHMSYWDRPEQIKAHL
uniref:DDHD domain-containing protein n=1 Tax=Panagrolaimus sp. ES5 TaxID=591445 RepID=A0AC34FXR7_9BILA